MDRTYYVLLDGEGRPFVSTRRGSAPLIGTVASLDEARALIRARIKARAARREGKGGIGGVKGL